MALGLLGIGFGAVHWAKTLMPDDGGRRGAAPAARHRRVARAAVVETLTGGGDVAQIARRPLIKYTLGGALGLVRRARSCCRWPAASARCPEEPVADVLERRS